MKLYANPRSGRLLKRTEDLYRVLVGSALLLGDAIVLFKDKKGNFYPVEILQTNTNIIFSLEGVSGTAKGVVSRLEKQKATTLVRINNRKAEEKYLEKFPMVSAFIMMIKTANGYDKMIRLKKGKNRDKFLEYKGRTFYILNKGGTSYRKFSNVKDFAEWASKNVSYFTFPGSFYAKTEKQRREAFKLVRLAESNSIQIAKSYNVSGNTQIVTTEPVAKMQRDIRQSRGASKKITFGF